MKWTWLNTTDEMNMNMIKYNRWNEHDQIQQMKWTWTNTKDGNKHD